MTASRNLSLTCPLVLDPNFHFRLWQEVHNYGVLQIVFFVSWEKKNLKLANINWYVPMYTFIDMHSTGLIQKL